MNNTVSIILSVLIGGSFGTVFSFLDHYMLLRALRNLSLDDEVKDKNIIQKAYVWRYVINIAVLLFIFVIREYLPFNWEYILIGAALGLTIPSRILAMRMGLEKKPNAGLKSRMTEPEKIDDLIPEKSEDGRVIVDENAFLGDDK